MVRVPKSMMEGAVHGFSGSAENAKISIAYEGVTYNQANTTNGHLAAGGNASVALQGSEIEMTFNIFSIVQYDNSSLSGYYKGATTVIE